MRLLKNMRLISMWAYQPYFTVLCMQHEIKGSVKIIKINVQLDGQCWELTC
jgi:hypothetical protein